MLTLALAQLPAFAQPARVMCRDGSWVTSGKACRHRGGTMPPPAYGYGGFRHGPGARPALARCRDGSMQYASRRTCRYNGGVRNWM